MAPRVCAEVGGEGPTSHPGPGGSGGTHHHHEAEELERGSKVAVCARAPLRLLGDTMRFERKQRTQSRRLPLAGMCACPLFDRARTPRKKSDVEEATKRSSR